MATAKKEAAKKAPKVVNVFVGRFDKPLDKVAVYATDTIATALQKAGIKVTNEMSVTDANAKKLSVTAKVVAGMDYFIAENYELGN